MAVYEYECRKCGIRVEIRKPMEEVDKPEWCEICGEEMDLVPSVPAPFRWGVGGGFA